MFNINNLKGNNYMKNIHIIVILFFSIIGILFSNEPNITINHIDGDKGEVLFSHEKHQKEFKVEQKEILCVTCHHTEKAQKEIKTCIECHVISGQEKIITDVTAPKVSQKNDEGKVAANSVLYHKICRECHGKVKNNTKGESITACSICHPKK